MSIEKIDEEKNCSFLGQMSDKKTVAIVCLCIWTIFDIYSNVTDNFHRAISLLFLNKLFISCCCVLNIGYTTVCQLDSSTTHFEADFCCCYSSIRKRMKRGQLKNTVLANRVIEGPSWLKSNPFNNFDLEVRIHTCNQSLYENSHYHWKIKNNNNT